jgi:hypothetical protein
MEKLSGLVNVPKIYSVSDDTLDMEYIHGLDMATYLSYNNPRKLIKFLLDTIDSLGYNAYDKEYTETYHKKLESIDFSVLPFTKEMLIKSLPRILPRSEYLGDMTLENIIYDVSGDRFVFIDLITSEYDSTVFDLAKLNQDLTCKWFIRKNNLNLDDKLLTIRKILAKNIPEYEQLTILMLLRILPYCKNDFDKQYIINEVKKLWT